MPEYLTARFRVVQVNCVRTRLMLARKQAPRSVSVESSKYFYSESLVRRPAAEVQELRQLARGIGTSTLHAHDLQI